MRSIWVITVAILLSTLGSACAPLHQPTPLPLESARKEMSFHGLFDVMPPRGDNWYEIQRKDGILAYGKKLESKTHTFIASVHVSKTDQHFLNGKDFLTFVMNQRANDSGSDRYIWLVNEEHLDTDRSEICTRFHQKAEDKIASKSSGSLSILEIKGVSCLHPRRPLIVTIEYSERGNAPFNNAALLNEGEGFVNSLQLK